MNYSRLLTRLLCLAVLLFAAAFQVLTIGLLSDLIEKKSRL